MAPGPRWHAGPFFFPITSKHGDGPFIQPQDCPGLLLIYVVPIDPPSLGYLDQALCAASVYQSWARAPDGTALSGPACAEHTTINPAL